MHTEPTPLDSLIQAVKTRRTFEVVCDQIREQIAKGRLMPGDRLPSDRELAEQFRVNRNAVREALRSLEMAGVIQTRTGVHGGVFVRAGPSDSLEQAMRDLMALGQLDVDHLAEARIVITSAVLRMACERASEADFDAIEADIVALERLARKGELSRNHEVLTRFYVLLAEAAHNGFMVMLSNALSEILRNWMLKIDPQVRPNFLTARRKVLKHLRAREADEAVSVMTKYLHSMHRYLLRQEKERNEQNLSSGSAYER